jgi:hypothetical protein
MRLLLLVLAPLLWSITGPRNEAPGLYARALRSHVATAKMDTLRVWCREEVALPARIGSHPVVQETLPERFLRGRSSTRAIRLLPLELQQGDVVVTLVDYVVSRQGQEVHLEFEANTSFRYRYHPSSKTYQLMSRKHAAL